jgi:hypothetical protein
MVVFPHPGGPQKHHRREPAPLDHAPDRGVVGEQVILTDDVGQRAWSETVGQRAGVVIHLEEGRVRLAHDRCFSRWPPASS